ncbi:MAG: hypothetical protein H6640_04530 [Caldilineaceae bacterium]|nr:hypothetical protein [Caldilineaceae bacterium]
MPARPVALSIWLAVASAAFAQPADPYSLWLPVIAGGVAQSANPPTRASPPAMTPQGPAPVLRRLAG